MGRKVHILSDIDPVARSATCANCGLVTIRRLNKSWRCNTGSRESFKWKQHRKNKCEHCGFVPQHKSQLDVDHIDGNKKNNDPSNLQTLCANCHRLKTHLNRDWEDKTVL